MESYAHVVEGKKKKEKKKRQAFGDSMREGDKCGGVGEGNACRFHLCVYVSALHKKCHVSGCVSSAAPPSSLPSALSPQGERDE